MSYALAWAVPDRTDVDTQQNNCLAAETTLTISNLEPYARHLVAQSGWVGDCLVEDAPNLFTALIHINLPRCFRIQHNPSRLLTAPFPR